MRPLSRPIRLVVDNHATEQAQFPDCLSLESDWAFINAESGYSAKTSLLSLEYPAFQDFSWR